MPGFQMRDLTDVKRSMLSESGALDLLVFIFDEGETRGLDLMKVHKNYARMFRLTKQLESKGLLKVVETRAPRLTYTIKLTAKGEKVAQKLREARELADR